MKRFLSSIFPFYASAIMIATALLVSTDAAYSSDSIEEPVDFHVFDASEDVRETVDWIQNNQDNRYLPFAVIDKQNTEIYIFDTENRFVANGPVLLGIAKYDSIDPETLHSRLSEITVEKRVTPSGRYRAVLGKDHRGKELLWVDYHYAIALHPVVFMPGQNRKIRLESKTSEDNRITYGCINISPALFKTVISPMFKEKGGFVYILPEEPANRGLIMGKR